jgi:hypothetical protein
MSDYKNHLKSKKIEEKRSRNKRQTILMKIATGYRNQSSIATEQINHKSDIEEINDDEDEDEDDEFFKQYRQRRLIGIYTQMIEKSDKL